MRHPVLQLNSAPMTHNFFPTPDDLSSRNGFSGNRLNRLGEQRNALDVVALHKDERARYYVLSEARQLLKSSRPLDALFTRSEVQLLKGNPDQAYLLGMHENGAAEFALDVPRQEEYPNGVTAVDLRTVARSGMLVGETLGAIAQARSLVLWHRTHRFCANCAAPTDVAQAGYARRCAVCNVNHFPRNDPVVIMLAIDGERCLLGRGPAFPEKMVSCLAGFIEVGETAEEAVRRELFEESGIRTQRVRYHSSQPWPFPSSFMIGFYAEAVSTDIATDDELEMCRWFTRDETRHILARTHPQGFWSPPQTAIAHQLMRGFVEGL